ncbi:MAG: 6-phospho-3-hexuloisomerase [Candidatus Hadarchaeales archaeon]
MEEILANLERTKCELDRGQVESFIQCLLRAKRVFALGAGRSGLVARAFAMRIMHLGLNVYVVGETITPSLQPEDVLVAVSGSGETDLVVGAASIAKRAGAKIAAVTSFPDSRLGRLADVVVVLPGRAKTETISEYVERELAGEHASLAPLGTLFEISAMVFLDGVIAALMHLLKKNEQDLLKRHANVQ